MADGFIQVPTDSTGKKLRTFVLPGGDHAEAVYLVDPNGDFAQAPESPQLAITTSASLAAGASVNLETGDITTGTTGKLEQVTIAASVPLKAEIATVVAGTPTFRDVVFTTDGRLTFPWRPPHKNWLTNAGGSTRRFRVRITNQDNADAADVYATFYWDEVT